MSEDRVLEPKPWPVASIREEGDKGKVDFDDDSGATIVSLRALVPTTDDLGLILELDCDPGVDLRLVVDGVAEQSVRQSVLDELRTVLDSYDELRSEYAALPEEEQEGTNYERYEDGLLLVVDDFALFVWKLLEGDADAGQAQGPQDQDSLGD